MRAALPIILFIWTGMNAYVFWRMWSVPMIARHVSRYVFVGLALILWTSYICGRILSHVEATSVARFFEVLGANWIGVLFLLLVSFLLVDVVTLFGFLFSRIAPTLRGCALAAGMIVSVVALVQGMRAPVVHSYEVQLPRLPVASDGTVLVFASDFHLGTMVRKGWLAARIDQIQAQQPDMIVLGGDVVEGDDLSEVELLTLLHRLSAPLGVWAVTGNHEFHAGGLDRGGGLLDQAGFHMLHDRWAEIKPGLVLAGVDDLTSRRHAGETGDFVKQALAGRPAGVATVLISHTPWDTEVAAATGVSLLLAGHTHEGQIWPFNYLARRKYPFFSGRYNVAGMTVIVCRGTGTWGPRMRLWKRAEIVRITLRSDQSR